MDTAGLFILLLCACFIALTLWNREWGFFLFIVLLPLYIARAHFSFLTIGKEFTFSYIEFFAYLLVGIILVCNWNQVYARAKVFFKEKLLLLAIVYIVTGVFLGVWQSNDAFQTLGIFRGWIVAPIVLSFATSALRIRKERVVQAFALSAVLFAGISIFAPNAFSADSRLQGFYGSPNYLAMYLSPMVPFVFYQIFRSRKDYSPIFLQAFWVLGAGAVGSAIFFTFSQGSWIGLLVAFAAGAFWYAKQHKALQKKQLIALALVLILFSEIAGQLFAENFIVASLHSRIGLWQASWNIGITHPLFGIGAGMFPTAYRIQKHFILYPVGLETALHPHNLFLTFWLYGGILGIGGFLLLLFWLAQKLYKRVAATSQKSAVFYGAIATAFMIILIHGLVDTTYWKNDLAFMWWILVGLIV